MMNKIISGILFLIGINVVAQIEAVTWKDFKLTGKVKSVDKKVFDNLDVATVVSNETTHNSYYTAFDKSGYIKKMRKKLPLSSLEVEGAYKYKRNILIELNMEWKQGYNVSESDSIRVEKSNINEVIVYNRNGGAMVNTIKNDTLYAKKMVRLNKELKVVELVSFDEKDHKKIGETNVYDEKGNLKLKNIINFFTKQDVTKKYNYDEKGNQIEELVIVRGETMKITKKYNEYNDLIEELAIMNGREFKNTSSYTYDSHHNFIEKIELTNDGKKIVTQRKIEYFE